MRSEDKKWILRTGKGVPCDEEESLEGITFLKPCISIGKVNGYYMVVACWKDKTGVSREFPLSIEIEDLHRRIKPQQSFENLFIVFIGSYSELLDIYPEDYFAPANLSEKPEMVLAIGNMDNSFVTSLASVVIPKEGAFYPETFEFEFYKEEAFDE